MVFKERKINKQCAYYSTKGTLKMKNLPKFEKFITDEVKSKITVSDFSVLDGIYRILNKANKQSTYISSSSLEKNTGLVDNTIRTSLKRLQDYKIIEINLILKNGLKHQFITLETNTENYVLPIKQKLRSKVNNFKKENLGGK